MLVHQWQTWHLLYKLTREGIEGSSGQEKIQIWLQQNYLGETFYLWNRDVLDRLHMVTETPSKSIIRTSSLKPSQNHIDALIVSTRNEAPCWDATNIIDPYIIGDVLYCLYYSKIIFWCASRKIIIFLLNTLYIKQKNLSLFPELYWMSKRK